MGSSPPHPPSPGCAGQPACPRRAAVGGGAPTGAFLATKAPRLLLPAHPRAPDPLPRPGVHGPVRVRSCLLGTPTPFSPRLQGADRGGDRSLATPGFFGGSLQHLRSGEPQRRLTDGPAGFRSGRWSALAPSEPCHSWTLPEPRCAAAIAASRPPPSPRGVRAARSCCTSRERSGPPAPGRDVRGEK